MPNLTDTAGQARFLLSSSHSWSEPRRISESPNQHVFFLITRAMSNTLQLNLLFELVYLTEFLFHYILGPSTLNKIQLYLSFRGRCWSDGLSCLRPYYASIMGVHPFCSFCPRDMPLTLTHPTAAQC